MPLDVSLDVALLSVELDVSLDDALLSEELDCELLLLDELQQHACEVASAVPTTSSCPKYV